MLRVIKTEGEVGKRNIVIRWTEDCICSDCEFSEDEILSGKFSADFACVEGRLTYADVCGLSMENGILKVECLETVSDAVEWCKNLEKYQVDGKCCFSVEMDCFDTEDGIPESFDYPEDAVFEEEFANIVLTRVSAVGEFDIPPCVTEIRKDVFADSGVTKLRLFGTLMPPCASTVKNSSIEEISCYKHSLYDLRYLPNYINISQYDVEA